MAKVDLGQQVGPLPLGAWIAVVGGGLGLAWYSRRQGDTGPPEIVEDVSGEPGVGTGPGWIAVPPPSGSPNAPTATTNEEWARQGINYLIAQGYDANVADSAVRKYMEANSLSVQEYALIRIVLNKFGAPPIPLPPGPEAPVVPPPAQQPPVTQPPVTQPPPVSTGYDLAAPNGFQRIGSGPTWMMLSWNAVPGANAYEWGVNGAYTSRGFQPQGVEAGLQPGQTYTFNVRALKLPFGKGPPGIIGIKTHA